MRVAEVRKLPPLERLLYWVREREAIRLRREAGEPPPWTDDEILQKYRFCNVRRMDDRVSRWLLEHWYKPHKDHPNTLAAAALARHFNVPATLAAVTALVYPPAGRPPMLHAIAETVRIRKASGATVFSAAYMVRGIGTEDKTEMVVERVVRPLVERPPALDPSSLERSVAALLPYWGFSTFMAGQVVADLRWALAGAWADRNAWAAPGPGSLRGLNRLRGRGPGDPAARHAWAKEFPAYVAEARRLLPHSITSRLEAIDYQNVLCEFSRYEKAIWGEGHPKRRYPSHEAV